MTKNITVSAIVSILVALGVGFAFHAAYPAPAPVSDQAVGSINGGLHNNPELFSKGTGLGGDNVSFTANGTMISGQNQVAWKNTFPRTVYVSTFNVTTTGTASSTFKIYAATSSTATIASDFNTTYASIINNFALATSSLATTTSNHDKALAGKIVPVASGQYVVLQLQAAAASCPTSGGSCESATSTNRGFNLTYQLGGYYSGN